MSSFLILRILLPLSTTASSPREVLRFSLVTGMIEGFFLSLKFLIRRDFWQWEKWTNIFGGWPDLSRDFFGIFMVALAYPSR